MQDSGRNPSLTQQTLLAVHVGEDEIKQPRALLQSLGYDSVILRGDDHRQQIERPRTRESSGIAIHVVGHAVIAQQSLDCIAPRLKIGGRETLKHPAQRPPVRPQRAVGQAHLIKSG